MLENLLGGAVGLVIFVILMRLIDRVAPGVPTKLSASGVVQSALDAQARIDALDAKGRIRRLWQREYARACPTCFGEGCPDCGRPIAAHDTMPDLPEIEG